MRTYTDFLQSVRSENLTQVQFFRRLIQYLGYEKQAYRITQQEVNYMLNSDETIIRTLPIEIMGYYSHEFPMTATELWNTYREEHNKYNKDAHDELLKFDTSKSGFKSEQKSQHLNLEPHRPKLTNYFPVKYNKRFQLHHTAPKNSFMIDIMYDKPYMYLVMININTRYVRADVLTHDANDTSSSDYNRRTPTYLGALTRTILSSILKRPIYLKGDSEKAFNSNKSKEFYKLNNISFTPVIAKNNHRSLAIIDRVIRTIRDMAYNIRPGIITPELIFHVINQYNRAPHNTLSHLVKFPCSPSQADQDERLHEEIIRRTREANIKIMGQSDYDISVGTQIKIEQPREALLKRRLVIRPDVYTIVKSTNSGYKVKGPDNEKIIKLPRSILTPIF